MTTVQEAIENLKPVFDAAKQWDILRRLLNEYAKNLLPEEPGLAHAASSEQLYALVTALKSARKACDSLQAEAFALEAKMDAYDAASKIVDAGVMLSLRAENKALRAELASRNNVPLAGRSLDYEDSRHCDHCDGTTIHVCRDTGHERDSSGDYQECKACGWYKFGMSSKCWPPMNVDTTN